VLFNTSSFVTFLAVVYALYLLLDHRRQNRMLLVASYFFYGTWDPRFLILILISTIVDYRCAIGIERANSDRVRKRYLFASVATNLTILGLFKYYGFFAGSLRALAIALGLELNLATLHVVLPVGISFYTFQTMGYTIDCYRRKILPERDFFTFALFVSFFPQLVAGPIERASRLLPQLTRRRTITPTMLREGVYLIALGYFQKVFVADNLARIVDPVFAPAAQPAGLDVLLAVYAFAFQIYCDFAGYSNIAIGVARCLGINLTENFRRPFFARGPMEFWRRWHISLSTWLRDYLYISLGGDRNGKRQAFRNMMLTMILGGLWHGAAWTFVLWGALHGLVIALYAWAGQANWVIRNRVRLTASTPVAVGQWLLLVSLFAFISALLFRSQSMAQTAGLTSALLFDLGASSGTAGGFALFLVLIVPLLLLEAVQEYRGDPFALLHTGPTWRVATLALACALIAYTYIFGSTASLESGHAFIYFQF